MEIPGLGAVEKHDEFDWYYSQPISVPVLDGMDCRIVIEAYDEDPRKDEFHEAIANFLQCSPAVLKAAEPYIFQYYQNCSEDWDPDEDEFLKIESAGDVWQYVQLGDEPMVTRRNYGDQGIYVSLSCYCDWEPEHGLQVVFKNGQRVNKVGAFDGHLTNSDAYGDDELEDVIYHGF